MTRLSTAGHGISLKAAHYGDLLRESFALGWGEALTENFLGRGGRPVAVLERIRRDTNIILHGVSMSIGGSDPLDEDYLLQLRALADRIEAAYVSDHLCFGSVGGVHGHDLWPLPLSEEALAHVIPRVQRVQDALGRALVIENVSAYVTYESSTMTEPEFISALLQATGAGLLLDVNNVYVSAYNLGFDATAYLKALPTEYVRYMHLAGHLDQGAYLLDNHGGPVSDEVLALYLVARARFGAVPTIVEWDSNLPALAGLLAESARVQQYVRENDHGPT